MSLQRPDIRPHVRRTAVLGAGICAVATFTGLLGHHLGAASRDEVVVAPVNVSTPAPIVTINPPSRVPDPPPAVVEPEPAPEPPAPPRPRALAPAIDAACVIGDLDTSSPISCSWDDGFPAISADGSTIVTKFRPDDGGRGNPGLSIHFIDARTSKVTRDALVLSPDEVDRITDKTKLQTLMTRRAAAIQASIDAGNYRSLAPLGAYHENDDEPHVDNTTIHAEISGNTVRIVDPTANTALWRHDFHVASPRHTKPDDECSGWGLWSMTIWWDPTARVVLADQVYRTGGCLCPDLTFETVARMPPT